MSANGKSTCKIVQSVDEVHMHIIELAHSMGFSNAIECEITGMSCMQIAPRENTENVQAYPPSDDNIVCIQQEEPPQTAFEQLSMNSKQMLCSILRIPVLAEKLSNCKKKYKKIAGSPHQCLSVLGDGNCFFRALSVCLSGSEESHENLRFQMCRHVKKNQALFKGILRSRSQSLEDYVERMNSVGTWATEFEKIAMSHMLNVNMEKIFWQLCRQSFLTYRRRHLPSSRQWKPLQCC